MTDVQKGFADGQGKPIKQKAGTRQIKVTEKKPRGKAPGNPELLQRGGKKEMLTDQMRDFCYWLLLLNNKASALRKAGYASKNPTSYANDLLKKPQVASYYEALKEERRRENEGLIDTIRGQLTEIMNADFTDFMDYEEARKAASKEGIDPNTIKFKHLFQGKNGRLIKSFKHGKFGIEFHLLSKESAYDMLLRMHGGYKADNEQKAGPQVQVYIPDNGRDKKPPEK